MENYSLREAFLVERVVVDTDGGIDDAVALSLLLRSHYVTAQGRRPVYGAQGSPCSAVQILGVTVVAGNVPLSFGVESVKQVVSLVASTASTHWKLGSAAHPCGKLVPIPIYAGAAGPMVGGRCVPSWTGHGSNGLGDIAFPELPKATSAFEVRDEVAACALVKLVNQYPGELTVLLLGPMTNLALAVRLDSTLPSKLGEFGRAI